MLGLWGLSSRRFALVSLSIALAFAHGDFEHGHDHDHGEGQCTHDHGHDGHSHGEGQCTHDHAGHIHGEGQAGHAEPPSPPEPEQSAEVRAYYAQQAAYKKMRQTEEAQVPADGGAHDPGHEGHSHEEAQAHDPGHEGHSHEEAQAHDHGHEGHSHEEAQAHDHGHEGHSHEEAQAHDHGHNHGEGQCTHDHGHDHEHETCGEDYHEELTITVLPHMPTVLPHAHEHHDHGHDHAAPRATSTSSWDTSLSQDAIFPATAIALTVFSGMSASLGGLAVVLLGVPSPTLLGHLLSFAAGIMLYVSYGDLLPHAISDMDVGGAGGHEEHAGHSHGGHGHVHGPGLFEANFWLFVGMVFFTGVAAGVPYLQGWLGGPEAAVVAHSHDLVAPQPAVGAASAEAASPSAGKGQASSKRSTSKGRRTVADAPAGPKSSTGAAAALSVPHHPEGSGALSPQRLWMTGMVAAIGISLHNLPEGLIVYNQTITGLCHATARLPGEPSALPSLLVPIADYFSLPADPGKCASRGLAVTMAIALHNIPEGMAVASPIYAATGSWRQAMQWTLLSSAAEPAAAVVFGLLYSSSLTPHVIAALNAGVAGIMIALCLVELMPAAAEATSPQAAAVSNIAGQLVMFLSLHAMRSAGVH